ncbi:hypothetical protein E4T56_gene19896, partial [Termitomyces sp. T112]
KRQVRGHPRQQSAIHQTQIGHHQAFQVIRLKLVEPPAIDPPMQPRGRPHRIAIEAQHQSLMQQRIVRKGIDAVETGQAAPPRRIMDKAQGPPSEHRAPDRRHSALLHRIPRAAARKDIARGQSVRLPLRDIGGLGRRERIGQVEQHPAATLAIALPTPDQPAHRRRPPDAGQAARRIDTQLRDPLARKQEEAIRPGRNPAPELRQLRQGHETGPLLAPLAFEQRFPLRRPGQFPARQLHPPRTRRQFPVIIPAPPSGSRPWSAHRPTHPPRKTAPPRAGRPPPAGIA